MSAPSAVTPPFSPPALSEAPTVPEPPTDSPPDAGTPPDAESATVVESPVLPAESLDVPWSTAASPAWSPAVGCAFLYASAASLSADSYAFAMARDE